jgi:hypothetical protein
MTTPETRHWLYELIKNEKADIQPVLSANSTVNWARSLALEIENEHGATAAEQFDMCISAFAKQKKTSSASATAAIFEPLFSSLTYSMSVASATLPEPSPTPEWRLPGIIVSWYYAYYTAVRAMGFAAGVDVPDTHSGVGAVFGSNLRRRMPHPLHMEARWDKDEAFICEFPGYPDDGSPENLKGTFAGTRNEARANLRAYLRGEARRQVDVVKEDLRRRGPKFANFKTKEAREARNTRLRDKTVNFMDCAFRYRGKANYRDAIYLGYGSQPLAERDEFVTALATSARFAFVCGLGFVCHRVGKSATQDFLEDVSRNLRGANVARPAELFWQGLSI